MKQFLMKIGQATAAFRAPFAYIVALGVFNAKAIPRRLAATLFLATCLLSHADDVLDWNKVLRTAVNTAPVLPGATQFRLAAIVEGSVFDAVNGIERRYAPIHVKPAGPADASRRAAAVQAAFTALVGVFPAQSNTFVVALTNSLAGIAADTATETVASIAEGRAWGEQVANEILAWRKTDGFDPTSTYQGSQTPGKWRPTPPANANGLAPSLAHTLPWVIPNPSFFRPPGPPRIDQCEVHRRLQRSKGHR